jgi:DNA-binding SARP family transcriptional activator
MTREAIAGRPASTPLRPGTAHRVDRVTELRIGLLGGFRVERAGAALPDSAWQRRAAKTLTKLLATHPSHALHREQILEIVWPDANVESARNSFAKALHAARDALEPERRPRNKSTYLHLRDEMLALDPEHVLIDADHFQRVAEKALRLGAGYEAALAAYTGELLPEDRYEDWSAPRRDRLAEIRILLLLELAEKLAQRGARAQAVDPLRAVLQQDPTREDVHRRLIRLYASLGARRLAIRQFEICRDVLRRDLNIAPERETEALYQDVLATRIPPARVTPDSRAVHTGVSPSWMTTGAGGTRLVGRGDVLELLRRQLAQAEAGNGSVFLVSGEAGVGKSRLVAEFLAGVRQAGVPVLVGGDGGRANRLPYAPFAVALEDFIAALSEAERTKLAFHYPTLTHLVPSLEPWTPVPSLTGDNDHVDLSLLTGIVRLLAEIARTQAVVVVLHDLHDAHSSSIALLQHLASFAGQHPWLVIGTLRCEGLEPGSELSRMLEATTRGRLCVHVELHRLARKECDELVRELLRGGAVEDALLKRIYTFSLGNPLFVEEIVSEMRGRDEVTLLDGRWRDSSYGSSRVPTRVRTLVAVQAASLAAPVQRVLELAAVAGERIGLEDLRRGAAALRPPPSEGELSDALDQALSSRLLVNRSGSYSFRHPLVRMALYEDLPDHRRAQLRAAVAGTGRGNSQNDGPPRR